MLSIIYWKVNSALYEVLNILNAKSCILDNVLWLQLLLKLQANCLSWMSIRYRVWHSYGFWHERISEYIRVKKMTRTNIRIYSYEFFDTNEYPNIFVSKNLHEWMSEYIRIKNLTQTNVRINIRIENCMNIRIYSNIRPVFTL